jgi:hypothetical protein
MDFSPFERSKAQRYWFANEKLIASSTSYYVIDVLVLVTRQRRSRIPVEATSEMCDPESLRACCATYFTLHLPRSPQVPTSQLSDPFRFTQGGERGSTNGKGTWTRSEQFPKRELPGPAGEPPQALAPGSCLPLTETMLPLSFLASACHRWRHTKRLRSR